MSQSLQKIKAHVKSKHSKRKMENQKEKLISEQNFAELLPNSERKVIPDFNGYVLPEVIRILEYTRQTNTSEISDLKQFSKDFCFDFSDVEEIDKKNDLCTVQSTAIATSDLKNRNNSPKQLNSRQNVKKKNKLQKKFIKSQFESFSEKMSKVAKKRSNFFQFYV